MRGGDAWFTTFKSQWEWVVLVGRGACVCWEPFLRVRGDRRNTQPKRRSECISRNISASRGSRFVSWTARKNVAVLRAGHAAFDWSESGPSFQHQKGRDAPWLSLDWTDGIEDMQEEPEWSRRYRRTETVMGTMTHRRRRCDRQLDPSQCLAAARRRENHRSTRVSWASFLKFYSFRDAARS